MTFKTEGGSYIYSWVCENCGNDNWGSWISMYATSCRQCGRDMEECAEEVVSHKVER